MSGPVRLSRFLVFVRQGEQIEVQHTVRCTSERIEADAHQRLLAFRGFRAPAPEDEAFIARGWLVRPFEDTLAAHGGAPPGSEARLDRDYQEWYWAREVESERELCWLGVIVLKMPTDLFVYQTLIAAHPVRSVLELGSGDGGGLWFFASLLALQGGGEVTGVERDPPDSLPPFSRWAGVQVDVHDGDALTEEMVRSVSRPEGFDLVVVDVGRRAPWGEALRLWAGSVAPGGYLAAEDVCDDAEWAAVDRFLLDRRDFGIVPGDLPMRKVVIFQQTSS